jgi:hypothetical protein
MHLGEAEALNRSLARFILSLVSVNLLLEADAVSVFLWSEPGQNGKVMLRVAVLIRG